MEQLKRLNFEAHAHIKNIVGQDMINDDNIAIKELIKNSIDADAGEVTISFIGTNNDSDKAQITVRDNGCGMSQDDIEQKWLNMAYSSKKSSENRSYAGNKGIGRFSADRLGSVLDLYTKQEKAKEIIKIAINWGEFEDKTDWKERISNIKFNSYSLSQKEFEDETGLEDFVQGTYLKISKPRYLWSSEKLWGLRRDIQKFMIPNQVTGGEKFKLFLNTSGYTKEKDKKSDAELSGRVENQVFDKLPFKVSYITSRIDSGGKEIRTQLYHRGELLVELREKNKYEHLKDAKIVIFHLNPYHKAFFKRHTEVRSVDYGSIFLYLNGFRVPPYGERDNDWLGVDRRHAQGHSRHLGLRDILGRIELQDYSGETYAPTSNREGLKRNDAFFQLKYKDIDEGFFWHTLKKLERFVVDALSWDSADEGGATIDKRLKSHTDNLDDFETHYKSSEAEKEKTLSGLLVSAVLLGTEKEDVIGQLSLGSRGVEILSRQHEEDIQKFQESLSKAGVKIQSGGKPFSIIDIIGKIGKAETVIKSLQQEKKVVVQRLEVSEKRRLFAESHMTSDKQKLEEVIHNTGTWGGRIRYTLGKSLKLLKSDKALSAEEADDLVSRIESAQMLGAKIEKLSSIIIKANFTLMTDRNLLDIASYTEQYIEEIQELGPYIAGLKIGFSNPKNSQFELNMSALEVSMLIDNIITNARKNGAKSLEIIIDESKDYFNIYFRDDGNGLTKNYKPSDLFKGGITTTSGAGMGLRQVKGIADNLDAEVTIENNKNKGAQVKLRWTK